MESSVIDTVARELRHASLALGLFVALVGPGAVNAQGTGRVVGTVTTTAITARPARVTMDQKVCGNEVADESILVNGAGGLANAVITLVGVKATAPAAAGIMNEKCRFSPHVQIISPNAAITTSSSDPILHTTNAQVDGGRILFNVAVPIPGMKVNKSVAGNGIIRLTCNTHPWMRGWLVVSDEKSAISAADGSFSLTEVPAGTYDLRIWHEALKSGSQRVTVVAGKPATVHVRMQ
jgi:hypothetical protein